MRREPLLLGTIGAVIGIILAVVVFGGRGGSGLIGASGEPTLPGQSVAPTTDAVISPSPVAVTVAPATSVPTAAPLTSAPTTAPTAKATPKPTRTPRPTATPNTNPTIVSFEVPSQEDCTGTTAGLVTLKWKVKNATGVTISIDGPGVFMAYPGLEDEEPLPYGCNEPQHTYTITTVGGTGPADTMTKTIKTRAPSIVSFDMGPGLIAHCAAESGAAGISLSYEVRAATGAELYRDDALYSTYNGKVVETTGIMYSCDRASQTFRLVTTGGYGDAASKTITVERRIP